MQARSEIRRTVVGDQTELLPRGDADVSRRRERLDARGQLKEGDGGEVLAGAVPESRPPPVAADDLLKHPGDGLCH
jgi:hypothetical protein